MHVIYLRGYVAPVKTKIKVFTTPFEWLQCELEAKLWWCIHLHSLSSSGTASSLDWCRNIDIVSSNIQGVPVQWLSIHSCSFHGPACSIKARTSVFAPSTPDSNEWNHLLLISEIRCVQLIMVYIMLIMKWMILTKQTGILYCLLHRCIEEGCLIDMHCFCGYFYKLMFSRKELTSWQTPA